VSDDFNQPIRPGRRSEIKDIWFETVLVLAVGAAAAFAANALSPRGLALARNYFPGGTTNAVSRAVAVSVPPPGASTNPVSAADLLAEQMREKGLQPVTHEQVVQRFRDPRFLQEKVIFVDARDEEHYEAGHVPGAWEFDPYRPEQHFAAVLPVCQAAEEVVVYCGGGDCEDSQFAAIALCDAGIPHTKLLVYAGGFLEWTTNGLPVEIGGRNSGNLRNATK
jgi:rhodanese-related sulfurtransferase